MYYISRSGLSGAGYLEKGENFALLNTYRSDDSSHPIGNGVHFPILNYQPAALDWEKPVLFREEERIWAEKRWVTFEEEIPFLNIDLTRPEGGWRQISTHWIHWVPSPWGMEGNWEARVWSFMVHEGTFPLMRGMNIGLLMGVNPPEMEDIDEGNILLHLPHPYKVREIFGKIVLCRHGFPVAELIESKWDDDGYTIVTQSPIEGEGGELNFEWPMATKLWPEVSLPEGLTCRVIPKGETTLLYYEFDISKIYPTRAALVGASKMEWEMEIPSISIEKRRIEELGEEAQRNIRLKIKNLLRRETTLPEDFFKEYGDVLVSVETAKNLGFCDPGIGRVREQYRLPESGKIGTFEGHPALENRNFVSVLIEAAAASKGE